MPILLITILCGVLLFIAIEDFGFLGVRWPAFPLLFVVALAYSLFQLNVSADILIFTGINILIVFVQYLGIMMYSYVKDRSTNVLNSKIGLGDFLFLFAITPLFHPMLLVLYLLTSLCLTLIVIFLRGVSDKHIPLAGYLSIFLILWLAITKLLHFNLYSPILNLS